MLGYANGTIDTNIFDSLKDLMDEEGFLEIIEFFCDDTTQALKNIRLAIQQNKVDYIKRTCHKLKSSSKLIGALHLAELSTRLEQLDQYDPPQQQLASQLIQQMDQDFLLIRQWLADMRAVQSA